MFGELFDDIRDMFTEIAHGTPTRTITVAGAYCAPLRNTITATFQRYGVRLYDFHEQTKYASRHELSWVGDVDTSKFPNRLPIAQVAQVTVSKAAAAWAEYLLLRTGRLKCPDGYIDQRNEQWAARHGGQMPPAWADGKPWIERSCSDGLKAWGPVRKAAKGKAI
ncbi:MAG: hypothetical protein R2867_00980 [Caldilineaceae bacterium]